MSSDGKRAGGHRRFGGSRLARPWTAPTQLDPVVDRLLQLLDAAMGATPRPLGRRLRQRAAPPGFSRDDTPRAWPLTATAAAGMATSWRTGRQHLNQDTEHEAQQTTVSQPSD